MEPTTQSRRDDHDVLPGVWLCASAVFTHRSDRLEHATERFAAECPAPIRDHGSRAGYLLVLGSCRAQFSHYRPDRRYSRYGDWRPRWPSRRLQGGDRRSCANALHRYLYRDPVAADPHLDRLASEGASVAPDDRSGAGGLQLAVAGEADPGPDSEPARARVRAHSLVLGQLHRTYPGAGDLPLRPDLGDGQFR